MSVQETTISKIQQMPDSLVKEVQDYIDFLLMRHHSGQWEMWQQFTEGTQIAEEGMAHYLPELEEYETQLEKGLIKW